MEGADVLLQDEGLIRVVPRRPVPAWLVEEARELKREVIQELVDEAEYREALLNWLPLRGSRVRVRSTGREGALWGVHGHGVTVDVGPGSPLLTLDPREVELVPDLVSPGL